ncbi:isoprenyl transferase [Paenibacillus antri]|uniref:Isoprenyl transferase n=1 Tax=Paenibacillus antri TaxID=2582848 RepID=A0A5R9G648_9BACL|nr:isoprenyl transferase [Paenibacillus antri]TLS49816.1 isoprenyl transferase [Paenibacillus antri]
MDRLFGWFRNKKPPGGEPILGENVPKHVAIIMDGNGRWARSHGMPRIAGHRAGMKNVKTITMAANDLGVKALTLYAFSTENWKRPQEEVDFLMKLPQEFFPLEIDELKANNVRIRMMGEREGLPEHTLRAVDAAIEDTKHNTGLILNFALNYGSRRELLLGMRRFAEEVKSGERDPDDLTEATFGGYLQSEGLPELDLLIRTSGEVRISNFMLWQLAYTELWFTDVYWPEFSEEHFYEAIRSYQGRARRYGKL